MPKNTPRCFKCQGYGHIASDCTNRRVVTLAEWESLKEEEEEGSIEERHEEVVIQAEEGDMVYLKPLLSIQSTIFIPTLKRNPILLHPQRNQQRISPSCSKWLN